MYSNILFDLDGTLTNPGIGITNSVAFALKKYGIEAESREELYKFIGPPLVDSFKEFYGFSDEKANEAVAFYREYFSEKGLFENEVYSGIESLLQSLKKDRKRLIVATSKPEQFAVKILEHFRLSEYFDFIAGATMDGTRSKKADVILHALKSCNITVLSSAVMVGDREHDIIGANKTGLHSIGVLYGYGGLEELKNAGATYIAATTDEIYKIISRKK